MAGSIVISDPYRTPITAQRHRDGGVVLRGPRSLLLLSDAELDRLVAFARDEPPRARIQRYAVQPEATQSDVQPLILP
jgi:hypothetical protein